MTTSQKKEKTSKKDKRKSKGVSLQGGGMTMSILELLQHIVNEPAPRLPEGRFPKEAEEFVDSCLLKEPDERETPKDLLVSTSTCSHIRVTNSRLCRIIHGSWPRENLRSTCRLGRTPFNSCHLPSAYSCCLYQISTDTVGFRFSHSVSHQP